jgi:hypothetical protein
MDSFEFGVENFKENREEFIPLLDKHWLELRIPIEETELAFDWIRFDALESFGMVHFVTMRKEGKLVGYQLSFIDTHLHHKNTLHAMVDLYYLLPEYRIGRNGLNLIKFAEAELIKRGVKKILTGATSIKDTSSLFEYLGYTKFESVFYKLVA